jgi:septum formation protein
MRAGQREGLTPSEPQIGLSHLEIIPSTVPEAFPKSLAPFEYVLQTATQKAMTVYKAEIDNASRGEPALVIAADTVVVTSTGQVLEKPRSEAEHIAMLTSLRDQVHHKVFTAVVAMAPLPSARDPGYALESTVEETSVRFGSDISDDMINAYVKTREGVDKAGGYGIQGIGAILVERIEGSFENVVGLPLRATLKLIDKVLRHDDELEDEFGILDEETEE